MASFGIRSIGLILNTIKKTIFSILINYLIYFFLSFLGWRHLQPNHYQALPSSWRCPRWYARRYAPRCWRYARCRCTPRCRIRTHCRRGRLICSLLHNKPHQQPEVSWFFLQTGNAGWFIHFWSSISPPCGEQTIMSKLLLKTKSFSNFLFLSDLNKTFKYNTIFSGVNHGSIYLFPPFD